MGQFLKIFVVFPLFFFNLEAYSKGYIPLQDSNEVAVYNTDTNTLVTRVPVGSGPSWVAITLDGTEAYVVNTNDGTISIIDTSTDKVVRTIYGASNANYIFMSPDGLHAVLLSDAIVVLDLTTEIFTYFNGYYELYWCSFSADGTYAYIGDGGNFTPPASVSIINLETLSLVARLNITTNNSYPINSVLSLDGTKVYVNAINYLYIIDTATNQFALNSPIPISDSASNIINVPANDSAYLGGNGTNSLVTQIIETTDTPITFSIPQGQVEWLTSTPDGDKVYTFGYDELSVIQTATNSSSTIATPVSVGKESFFIACQPDGLQVWAIEPRENQVYIVNTSSNTVVKSFTLNTAPQMIAFLMAPPIPPGPTPPATFVGKQVLNRFLLQRDFVNFLTFTQSLDPTTVGYHLYRNGLLVATFPVTGPFNYSEAVLPKVENVYTIAAFNSSGTDGAVDTVILP